MTHHLLIAHGSPDPRHGAFVRSLATAVSARGSAACDVAFLEHDTPRAEEWLGAARGAVTTLGLLLAPGYHARVDIPRLLAGASAATTVTDRGVLGAGPWLFAALDELVAGVGGGPSTPVVVVSAGSSRAEARAHVHDFVGSWAGTRPGPARTVTDLADLPDEVDGLVDPLVVPFVVAPGVFADRIAAASGDLGLRSTPVLGVADAFVDGILERLGAGVPDLGARRAVEIGA